MEVDDAVPRGGGGGGESPHIRTEESVVNRIAAGKVIHRTSSAVQDLIENTIDADSSIISVTIKDGSLKLIQVSDDGYVIRVQGDDCMEHLMG
ncbi:mutL-like protein 1 [Hordeum vulgare]|nr:mutL-like protein 1 [Hordeum vulgare]